MHAISYLIIYKARAINVFCDLFRRLNKRACGVIHPFVLSATTVWPLEESGWTCEKRTIWKDGYSCGLAGMQHHTASLQDTIRRTPANTWRPGT